MTYKHRRPKGGQPPISFIVTYELFETLMYCVPPPSSKTRGHLCIQAKKVVVKTLCLCCWSFTHLAFYFLNSGMYSMQYKSERNLEIHVDSYNKIKKSSVTPSSLENNNPPDSLHMITESIMSRTRTMFYFAVSLPWRFEIFVCWGGPLSFPAAYAPSACSTTLLIPSHLQHHNSMAVGKLQVLLFSVGKLQVLLLSVGSLQEPTIVRTLTG